MDKGKSLQVLTDLLADMNAYIIQDNNQMPFSKSLLQLGKKPLAATFSFAIPE